MPSPSFTSWLKQHASDTYGGVGGKAFLASDVAGIATADNKLKALGRTLKDFALWKITFPATITAGLLGVQKVVRSLAADTGTLDAAISKLGKIKFYSAQLEPLTKSLAAAQAQLAALMQFERKSPFNLGQVVAASKILHTFSGGVLGSGQSLKLAENIARSSGSGIDDAADAYGSFYKALKNGAPVREVSGALERMGVLNDQTITQLEQMQERGASFAQVMGAATEAMTKQSHHAEDLSRSIEVLSKNADEAKESMKAAFGKPFLEEERKGMESAIKIATALTPVMEALAAPFSRIGLYGQGVRRSIREGAADAAGAAAPIAGVAGNVLEAGLEVGIPYAAATAATHAIKAAPGVPAAYAAAKGVASRGVGTVATAAKGIAQEQEAQMLFGGGNKAIYFASKAAQSASEGLGAFLLAPLATLGKFVSGLFKLITPMGWIITIATTAKAVLETMTDAMNREADAAQAMMQAHIGSEQAIKKMINTVQTADDAISALTAANEQLANAQKEVAEAKEPGWFRKYGGYIFHPLALMGPPPNPKEEAETHRDAARSAVNKARNAVGTGYISKGEQSVMEVQAERAIRMQSAQLENQLSLTSGSAHIDLLKQQAQTYQGKHEQGQEYEVAKAEYDKQSANLAALDISPEDRKRLDRDSKRARGGLLAEQSHIDEDKENLDESRRTGKINDAQYHQGLGDIAQRTANVNAQIQDVTGGNYGEKALQAKTAAILAQRELDITNLRIDAESKIAGLKTTGVDRQIDELEITTQRLMLEAEEFDKQGNKEAARQARAEASATHVAKIQADAQKEMDEASLEAKEKMASSINHGIARENEEYEAQQDVLEKQAQAIEGRYGTGDSRARELRAKQEENKIAHELRIAEQKGDEASLEAQEKINNSKEIGTTRARQEFSEGQKALRSRITALQAANASPEEIRALESQYSGNEFSETQRQRQVAVSRAGAGSELAITQAQAGLTPGVDLRHLQQVQELGQTYESVRGMFKTDQEAQSYAEQMEQAKVQQRNVSAFTGQTAVVDSLQAIGGGGNIAHQGVSMSEIMKDQLDVQKEMAEYLSTIAGDTGDTMK